MPESSAEKQPVTGKLRNKTPKAAAAVLLIISAAALLVFLGFLLFRPQYLTISNGKTGWIYAVYPCPEGTEFKVEFIHSVNLSPVIDHFAAGDGIIRATIAEYYTFGAGMPTSSTKGKNWKGDPTVPSGSRGFPIPTNP